MNWNSIFTFFISASAITGAIVYIGKRIVDKSLDLALEKYKNTLARDLETHKKELDKVLFEHQIMFGKLHQDRLDSIKLINTQLYKFKETFTIITQKGEAEEWLRKDRNKYIETELKELQDLIEINQIYFSDEIRVRFFEILKEGWQIQADLVSIEIDDLKILIKQLDHIELSEEEKVAPINKLLGMINDIRSKIEDVRDKIMKEFRKLIGVD
jgi:hypothetical protein